MTNYKEILRLHSLEINNIRIAESCGCARSTVIPYDFPVTRSISGTSHRHTSIVGILVLAVPEDGGLLRLLFRLLGGFPMTGSRHEQQASAITATG